jgi:hypothetical protein
MEHAYKIVIVKLEGKGLLRRSRLRWEDNIKVDHSEVIFEG